MRSVSLGVPFKTTGHTGADTGAGFRVWGSGGCPTFGTVESCVAPCFPFFLADWAADQGIPVRNGIHGDFATVR